MNDLFDHTLQNKNALQNIGPISRVVRSLSGFASIALAVFLLGSTSVSPVISLLLLTAGVTLVMSGAMGWCPVRALTHSKSCGIEGHTPCGTLPFQLQQLFHR